MTAPTRRAAALAVLALLAAAPAASADPQDGGRPAAPASAEKPSPEERDARVKDIAKRLKAREPEVRRAALADASTEPAGALADALAPLLQDGDTAVRSLAIDALARREEGPGRKSAARALVAALRQADSRRGQPASAAGPAPADLPLLVQALHDLADPVAIEPLVDGIDDSMDVSEVRARLRAVGNVPHADAIEALIRYSAQDRRGADARWATAREALRYATGHDTGSGDPDRWRAWWRENGKTFDFAAAAAARAAEREAAAEKERRRAEAEEKRRKREEEGGDAKPERKGRKKKKGEEESEDGDGEGDSGEGGGA